MGMAHLLLLNWIPVQMLTTSLWMLLKDIKFKFRMNGYGTPVWRAARHRCCTRGKVLHPTHSFRERHFTKCVLSIEPNHGTWNTLSIIKAMKNHTRHACYRVEVFGVVLILYWTIVGCNAIPMTSLRASNMHFCHWSFLPLFSWRLPIALGLDAWAALRLAAFS